MITVIVPALNEEGVIAGALESLSCQGGAWEAIVVDGGSTDRTREVARRYARVLTSGRGRARQMNAGAEAARGEVLLFLHADSKLQPGALAEVGRAVEGGAVGGGFRLRLEGGRLYGLISRLASLRARLEGIYLGDHAIFVARDAFTAVGGFRALPLMEDVDLCRRLKAQGRLVQLGMEVRSSPRRLQGRVLRTLFLMQVLRLLYYLGVPPARLEALYGR
ncbi:MAG: TIGR04283 family arsenosugar biosynthesis glycosyltransferase [Candidatus Hydrothermarchaeota archaeon]